MRLLAAACALTAAPILPAVAAAAPRGVVRTGGPSLSGEPKLAVVAGSQKLAGRAFRVVDAGGQVVLRGTLRGAVGSPEPWRRAAIADLSGVTRPGSYRVIAAGMRAPRPWIVDDGAERHALLRRLLRIFAVNADGDEPNAVFGPAHRKDAIATSGPKQGERVDLTGGWRDAGDHLKFASTTAFAMICLELAARLAPDHAAELRTTSHVGLRWLLRAHPAPGAFYVEVGDVRDHSTGFRDPARDDADERPGVGVRYAYTSDSANVLAKVGGAIALVAARSDPASRDVLLGFARDWIAAAQASSRLTRIDSTFVEDFHPDVDVADDLAFASAALFRATGDPADAAAAAAALRSGGDEQFYRGVTAGSLAPLVAADMCGALGAPPMPGDAAVVGCEGVRKVLTAARHRMSANAFATPGIVTWGWVQDNNGAGVIATAAARAGIEPERARVVAAAARDYLFGRNPWGRSFVVGPGRYEARRPHHPAYLKGPPTRLLDGAVVGGPARPLDLRGARLRPARGDLARFNSSSTVYEDRRSDFVTSEVGLSYSASALLLIAALNGS